MSGPLRVAFAAGSVSLALLIDYLVSRADVRYAPGIGGALVIAFLATQVGVWAAWVAVSGPSLVQLFASVCLSLGVWQFLHTWNERAMDEFGPGFVSETITVFVVLAVMRACRFRMLAIVPDDRAQGTMSPVPRYSIRDLLIGTALVGGALAILVRMQAMNVTRDATKISTVVGIFLGTITLLSFFSMLAFQRAVIPAAVTCAAGLLLGRAVGLAIQYDEVVSTVGLGAAAVLQLGVFMLVRLAGYRFERAQNAALD